MTKSINKSGHELVWSDRILAYVGTIQQKTTGGIILLTDSERNKILSTTEGVIVEIGEECFSKAKRKPKIKDLICFPMHSASSVVEGDDGGIYFVLKDTSINTIHRK